MFAARLGAALLALLALLGPARAETVDCAPITALPLVITTQDVYCLTADINFAPGAGNAIDVQTNNVVIDLNGFTLGGVAGAGTSAIGIHALDRLNVTIKNGTIRGFLKGIFLETSGLSQGHVVDSVRADQNTFVGIHVDGTGNVVRDSQVARTGGTTILGANADAIGILATGPGPRMIENDITDTVKQGTGAAVAIQFQAGTVGGFADSNRITNADRGVEFVAGASGKCRGNLLFTVTTFFVGCTDSGSPQPPLLTAGATLNYTENDPATIIDGTVTVTDADSANLIGAEVQITVNCNSPQDVLSFTNQNGITGNYTAASCLMSLSGSSSVANYQAALRSVRYSNTSDTPNTGTRTVTWVADDGQSGSVPVTSTINVAAANDPPAANGFTNLPAQAGIPIAYPVGKLGGTDPEGTAVTVDTTPDSLCASCLLTINADGSFTFTPPPSSAGTTVQFTYHVTDSGTPPPGVNSPPAIVSFAVAGPAIYFVKQSAVGAGTCTLGNECTLATAQTSIGAATNTRIFVGDNATHSSSVTLNSNGWLIGQGVTGTTFDALFGIVAPAQGTLAARPATNQAPPTISVAVAGTNVVNLNGAGTTNSVRGLNLTTGSATTKGINGTSFGTLTTSDIVISGSGPALDLATGSLSGSFTTISSSGGANNIRLATVGGSSALGSGALSGATANSFDVTGGNATLSYNGTIASGSAHSVNIAGKTGGSVTFNGAVTDTDTGVSLTGNTGATISFTGGLNLNTGANAAFTATGGGTVSATQNNTSIVNTLTTTTGTALNVANTTIGASGLTFRSISSNGAVNGIVLNATGASGGLTVSGNAGNCTSVPTCSGGAIQNATNAAISLTSTLSPSFDRIAIQNAARSGIDGQSVTNFTLSNSFIDNVGTGAAGQYEESNVAFNDSGTFTNSSVSGTVSITNSTLTNARRHGIEIENGAGTIGNLTISNNTLTSSTNAATSLGSAILILQQGSAATASHLTTGTISNNIINNFPSAEGIAVLGGIGSATNNTPATLGANGTPIAITSNTINGGATRMGSNAIRVSFNGKFGVSNFDISCNGSTNGGAGCSATGPLTNFQGLGISVFMGGTVTGTTTVNNNVIVSNQTLGAGSSGIAVQADDGPDGLGTADPDVNVTINNNNVSANEGTGIRAIARASNRAKLDVTIQNNTVAAPTLLNRNGIRVDSGSAAGDTSLCLLMTGNVSDGSGINQGIGIRKQGTNSAVNVFGITGLVPSPTSAANAAAKVAADNPAGNNVDVLSGDNFVSCVVTP